MSASDGPGQERDELHALVFAQGSLVRKRNEQILCELKRRRAAFRPEQTSAEQIRAHVFANVCLDARIQSREKSLRDAPKMKEPQEGDDEEECASEGPSERAQVVEEDDVGDDSDGPESASNFELDPDSDSESD